MKENIKLIQKIRAIAEDLEMNKEGLSLNKDFVKETTYKRLDLILYHLFSIPNNDGVTIFEIHIEIKKQGYNARGSAIKRTLDKLQKDKFIKKSPEIYLNASKIETTDDVYRITLEGEALIEIEGGYAGRHEKENREKKSAKLNNTVIKIFTGLATFGTVGVFVFEVSTYESPSKIGSLEMQNKIIKIEKGQLEELYHQSIYTEARSYQYEKELLKLRDSLSSAKRK